MKHPIQPLQLDKSGVLRFKENPIVRYMLDMGFIDMNRIACLPNIREEDHEQFAQLIGYSLSGFGELSYVSDETYSAAEKMYKEGKTVEQARVEALEIERDRLRSQLSSMVKVAYQFDDETLKEWEKK